MKFERHTTNTYSLSLPSRQLNTSSVVFVFYGAWFWEGFFYTRASRREKQERKKKKKEKREEREEESKKGLKVKSVDDDDLRLLPGTGDSSFSELTTRERETQVETERRSKPAGGNERTVHEVSAKHHTPPILLYYILSLSLSLSFSLSLWK